jgi:ATP-dependent helicase YprA (DUF1998 family)
MKLTIDSEIRQLIDAVLKECRECEQRKLCPKPYTTSKDVVRSALIKFGTMDCFIYESDKE